MNKRPHRGTIFLEEAEVLDHEAFEEDQYTLRIREPECAAHARPGTFVHLQCDRLRPLRRPLSIMRASGDEGWVDFLYKAVGDGTRLLAERKPSALMCSPGLRSASRRVPSPTAL